MHGAIQKIKLASFFMGHAVDWWWLVSVCWYNPEMLSNDRFNLWVYSKSSGKVGEFESYRGKFGEVTRSLGIAKEKLVREIRLLFTSCLLQRQCLLAHYCVIVFLVVLFWHVELRCEPVPYYCCIPLLLLLIYCCWLCMTSGDCIVAKSATEYQLELVNWWSCSKGWS